MAGTLSTISLIAFLLAGAFLVISIILFARFNIPEVISDLSGKSARRSIKLMREESEKEQKKRKENLLYKSNKNTDSLSKNNEEAAENISKKSESKSLVKTEIGIQKLENATEKLDMEIEKEDTEILSKGKFNTEKLIVKENDTELMSNEDNERTEFLGEFSAKSKLKIEIIEEIMLVDTNITIE